MKTIFVFFIVFIIVALADPGHDHASDSNDGGTGTPKPGGTGTPQPGGTGTPKPSQPPGAAKAGKVILKFQSFSDDACTSPTGNTYILSSKCIDFTNVQDGIENFMINWDGTTASLNKFKYVSKNMLCDKDGTTVVSENKFTVNGSECVLKMKLLDVQSSFDLPAGYAILHHMGSCNSEKNKASVWRVDIPSSCIPASQGGYSSGSYFSADCTANTRTFYNSATCTGNAVSTEKILPRSDPNSCGFEANTKDNDRNGNRRQAICMSESWKVGVSAADPVQPKVDPKCASSPSTPFWCSEVAKCTTDPVECKTNKDGASKKCSDENKQACPNDANKCVKKLSDCVGGGGGYNPGYGPTPTPTGTAPPKCTKTLCWDRTCVKDLSQCPAFPQCKGTGIVRCPDSSCDTLASCKAQTKPTCSSTQRYCSDAGMCVDSDAKCPNFNGCSVGKTQCADGKCEDDCSSRCGTGNQLCSNGKCIASAVACPTYIPFNKREDMKPADGSATVNMPNDSSKQQLSFKSADGSKNAISISFDKKSFSAVPSGGSLTFAVTATPDSTTQNAKLPGKQYSSFVDIVTDVSVDGSVTACLTVDTADTANPESKMLGYLNTDTNTFEKGNTSSLTVGEDGTSLCGSITHLSTWGVFSSSATHVIASALMMIVCVVFVATY